MRSPAPNISTHTSETKQVKYNPRLGPGNQGYFLDSALAVPAVYPAAPGVGPWHMWSLQLAATHGATQAPS